MIFKVLNDVKQNISENMVSMKGEVHGVFTEQAVHQKLLHLFRLCPRPPRVQST